MRTLRQRFIRRKDPVAGAAHRHNADLHAIIKNVQRRTRFRATAQRRARFIRSLSRCQRPGQRTGRIDDGDNLRRGRGCGIHRNAKGRGGCAGVACRIAGSGGKTVHPVRQRCVRRKGPCASIIDQRGADRRAVIEDLHGRARDARPAEERPGVISDLVLRQRTGNRTDIISNASDGRRSWRSGIDGEIKARRGWPGIACGIHRAQREAVRPAGEGCRRGKGPGSAAADQCAADLCTVVKNQHCGVSLSSTVERRRGVIGRLAGDELPGNGADVIHHAGQDRQRWGEGIHHHRERRRGRAGIACRVGGDRCQHVLAFAQRGGRGKAPVPLGIRHDALQQLVVIVNSDRRPGFRRAAQPRLRIVGDLAADQRAGQRINIVGDVGDDWRIRRDGINDNRDRRGGAARTVCVGGIHREGMRTVGERRGQVV